MKENYTHITLVLDKSGSMQTILKDTLGGFNAFLAGQKETAKEGDTFSLLQFSTDQNFTYKLARIQDVAELTNKTYIPAGGTALLDAAADTIRDLGKHFASLKESDRPGKVIFVILTDGEENASHRTTKDMLNALITEHTNIWKWEFVFLGANQNAIAEAAKYGIAAGSSLTFGANKLGVAGTYESLTRSLNTFKAAPQGVGYAASGASFTLSERTASMGGNIPIVSAGDAAAPSVNVTVNLSTSGAPVATP